MSNLTVHQQAVLTVISNGREMPAQMSSVIEALPQYTKQQAAMIVGSLCMKEELVVSTAPMMRHHAKQMRRASARLAKLREELNEANSRIQTELNEQLVFEYLEANRDAATRIIQALQSPVAEPEPAAVAEEPRDPRIPEEGEILHFSPQENVPAIEGESEDDYWARVAVAKKAFDVKHKKKFNLLKKAYIAELKAAMTLPNPVILPEFNAEYLSRFKGADWRFLHYNMFFFLKGKIVEELQKDNLEKILGHYLEEMKAGKGLEFWSKEANTFYEGKVRFYGDRVHYVQDISSGKLIFSFDREYAEACLWAFISEYETKYAQLDNTHLTHFASLLGLSSVEALSAKELKTAFRKASMQHHPDRGGDAEMMIAVNEAYDALSKIVK